MESDRSKVKPSRKISFKPRIRPLSKTSIPPITTREPVDDALQSSQPQVNEKQTTPRSHEKKYKDPWDYKNSNPPFVHPQRPPSSLDPDTLNEAEFWEKEEKCNDENVANDAKKLGLEAKDEGKLILFQFPKKLPISSSHDSFIEHLIEMDLSGKMGKIMVYESGAVKLMLGDLPFLVYPGVTPSCVNDVVAINTKVGNIVNLGSLSNYSTVVPDIDSLLG